MTTPQPHDGPSRSSSASLSSPPHTSPEPGSPSAQFANEQSQSITVNPVDFGVADKPAAPVKERRKPRKPRNSAPAPEPVATNEVPKRRRVAKPKDPNAPPRQRKRRNEDSLDGAASDVRAASGTPSQHPKIIESPYQGLAEQQSKPHPPITKDEAIHTQRPIHSFFNVPPPPPPQHAQHQAPPPTQQQQQQQQQQQSIRTSGQNYDPIRSHYDAVRETVVSHNHYGSAQASPNQLPPSTNRASASPSISSLVDPPNQALTSPSIAAQSFFNQQQRLQRDENYINSVPPSPTANRLAPSAMGDPSVNSRPPSHTMNNRLVSGFSPEDTAAAAAGTKKPEGRSNSNATGPLTTSKKITGASTTTSSAAASPKPPKPKDAKELYPTPPPLPGSGLLGGLGQPNDGTEFRAPTVVLNIPMSFGETNKYVNFTRLAEDRYGWDALHPRLAAQRDRLARVAAAGAALERNGSNRESGDEMSLDSEGEGSNVEMGGMSDGRTGTDGGAKKIPRKRKMKEDEYDKDDGFVDDTELLWEEQAAATNDGFFVYSGPLVPEGEKPTLELRADGAPKRARGRGSRGGALRVTALRGARGGLEIGTGTGTGTGPATGRSGLPVSGPGSRGGSITRKPRITKADRVRMEQEKMEREKMGGSIAAQMPGGGGGGGYGGVGGGHQQQPGMPQLAAAGLGNTPMVFHINQ